MAVPAFLSRMFRHSAVYIRSDRGIDGPADLRGKRIGVPEYQMSAALWVRGFLADEFAVAAKDINWVQGGLETPGRRDKFPLNLPAGFPLASAPSGKTLSAMLAEGELDAVISARRPCFVAGHPKVRRLFPDYRAAERDYYRRSGVFPIMHAVGIRPDLLERHPWLAASVYKAFVEAKRIADADLAETTALKIGLPWVTAELDATRDDGGRFLVLRRAGQPQVPGVDGALFLRAGARSAGHGRGDVRGTLANFGFEETTMSVQLICCSHSPLMTTDVEESEANVHAGFSASSTPAPPRCAPSIPIWWWCSGRITSTASSTS